MFSWKNTVKVFPYEFKHVLLYISKLNHNFLEFLSLTCNNVIWLQWIFCLLYIFEILKNECEFKLGWIKVVTQFMRKWLKNPIQTA